MLILWPHGGKIMSSIKNISASNPVPNDLAKRLGNDGIGVILATLWLGYKDLYAIIGIIRELKIIIIFFRIGRLFLLIL